MNRPQRLHFFAKWLGVLLIGLAAQLIAQDRGFRWEIPPPFPRPAVPADNPMSPAKVELGRRLFYDKRLSVNGQQACASCHRQDLAFTDGRPHAEGTTGEAHPRNSMSLANVGYNPLLTWANPSLSSLEDQARIPIFGSEPIELGMTGKEEQFLHQIAADPIYQQLFPKAFAESSPLYSMNNVTKAIAAFERTLVSVNSPYDRYKYGSEPNALSDSAKRGEVLFFSGERTACFQCHGGWNFNGVVRNENGPEARVDFFNTGLYNLKGAFSYPLPNTGLQQFTNRAADVGKFRVPTLRNIAVTGPYMHDGSIETLSDVIDHYAAGGRTIVSGPYAGIGHDNPNVYG